LVLNFEKPQQNVLNKAKVIFLITHRWFIKEASKKSELFGAAKSTRMQIR